MTRTNKNNKTVTTNKVTKAKAKAKTTKQIVNANLKAAINEYLQKNVSISGFANELKQAKKTSVNSKHLFAFLKSVKVTPSKVTFDVVLNVLKQFNKDVNSDGDKIKFFTIKTVLTCFAQSYFLSIETPEQTEQRIIKTAKGIETKKTNVAKKAKEAKIDVTFLSYGKISFEIDNLNLQIIECKVKTDKTKLKAILAKLAVTKGKMFTALSKVA